MCHFQNTDEVFTLIKIEVNVIDITLWHQMTVHSAKPLINQETQRTLIMNTHQLK